MLDSYIIDSIKRDERTREEGERARLHLPLHDEDLGDAPDAQSEPDADRGILIIPLRDDTSAA
ncbi:MAG: hypothetical protein AAFZ18_28610 [Myxococcota bacterium]